MLVVQHDNALHSTASVLFFSMYLILYHSNVITYFVLGECIHDFTLIYNWQDKTLKQPFKRKSSENEDMEIANELFKQIESTKNVRELKNVIERASIIFPDNSDVKFFPIYVPISVSLPLKVVPKSS